MSLPITEMQVKTDACTDFRTLISPLLTSNFRSCYYTHTPSHPHPLYQVQPYSVSCAGFALLFSAKFSAWVAYTHTNTHKCTAQLFLQQEGATRELSAGYRVAPISSQATPSQQGFITPTSHSTPVQVKVYT